MKKEHVETILWLLMISIISFLSVRMDKNAEDMDCNECTVMFKNKLPGGDYSDFGEYKIKDLYYELYHESKCTLSWNPTQGYSISHREVE